VLGRVYDSPIVVRSGKVQKVNMWFLYKNEIKLLGVDVVEEVELGYK